MRAIIGSAALALAVVPALAQQSPYAEYQKMARESAPVELFELGGEELWKKKQGPKNVSLEQCDLGLGPGVVKGAYVQLPRYFKDTNSVLDFEGRLVHCMVSLQGFERAELVKAPFSGAGQRQTDIEALTAPGALQAVAASGCGVCLMHKKGDPATMQEDPTYGDVLAEVRDYLAGRITACERAGIARERIVADPGFGFGKTAQHNLQLLRRLGEFRELGVPLMAGLSRKSTLGIITGRPVEERLAGSLAMALLALLGGAKILRVHDVKETKDVISVWQAFHGA